MSEDTKSSTHRGRRVLVLANPDPGDSSNSDDDRRRGPQPHHHPQSSHSSLQQSSSSMLPPPSHRAIPKPANPTLTTDISTSSHSNPTLSSPSSQSSNAVESTPPPSTPGQAVPPDIATTLFTHDDGSAVNERSDLPHPSRIQKVADKFWKSRRDSSHRPKESESSLHVITSFLCYMPLLTVAYSLQPLLAICLPQTESSWLPMTATLSRQLTSLPQIAQLSSGSGSSQRFPLSPSFAIVTDPIPPAQNSG